MKGDVINAYKRLMEYASIVGDVQLSDTIRKEANRLVGNYNKVCLQLIGEEE